METERMRVRAPELHGRRWLNTGGAELTLAGLRGRIVVLDFWTFCCPYFSAGHVNGAR